MILIEVLELEIVVTLDVGLGELIITLPTVPLSKSQFVVDSLLILLSVVLKSCSKTVASAARIRPPVRIFLMMSYLLN